MENSTDRSNCRNRLNGSVMRSRELSGYDDAQERSVSPVDRSGFPRRDGARRLLPRRGHEGSRRRLLRAARGSARTRARRRAAAERAPGLLALGFSVEVTKAAHARASGLHARERPQCVAGAGGVGAVVLWRGEDRAGQRGAVRRVGRAVRQAGRGGVLGHGRTRRAGAAGDLGGRCGLGKGSVVDVDFGYTHS